MLDAKVAKEAVVLVDDVAAEIIPAREGLRLALLALVGEELLAGCMQGVSRSGRTRRARWCKIVTRITPFIDRPISAAVVNVYQVGRYVLACTFGLETYAFQRAS